MENNKLQISPKISTEAYKAKGDAFIEALYTLRELQQILGEVKFQYLISEAFGIDETEAYSQGKIDAFLEIKSILDEKYEEVKSEDIGFSEAKANLILLDELIDLLVEDYLKYFEESK